LLKFLDNVITENSNIEIIDNVHIHFHLQAK